MKLVVINGKNCTETLADVAKGIETVGFVCSLPHMAQGKILEVSRGVMYQDERIPLDFEAYIVPIALVMVNCVVLKPSEKVLAKLMVEAFFRKGVFDMVNVSVEAVNALITKRLVRCFVLSRKFCQVYASR